jgi:hypothetical protein
MDSRVEGRCVYRFRLIRGIAVGAAKIIRKAIPVKVLAAAAAVFLICAPMFSQGNAGRILGVVADQQGAAVAGASVTITDTQRGVSRTLNTDDAGEFNAPNLLPGSYSVRAEAQGFRPTERTGLTLEVNQDLRVDIQLQIGAETEKVEVSADAPVIETTGAAIGGTIPNLVMNELPLNGRNFQNLITMRPGMTIYPGGGSWTQSTDGLRPHDQMYLVDGINSNDPSIAMSVMNAPLLAGDGGTMLPIEAIDEFRSEVNPPAEFGWRPGSVVNVSIKSGTNSLHGSAFAYGRDQAFDARDYFAAPAPAPAPPLSLEQFGGSLGGPIKKDKLFFFADYEDQRYLVGSPAKHTAPITGGANATVYTTSGGTLIPGLIGACENALAGTGVAAPGVAALSAQMAGLSTSCVPLANYPGLFLPNSTGAEEIGTAFNTTSQIDSGVTKFDYNLNDKQQLHGSYFISQGKGVVVDNPPKQIATNWLSDQFARSQVAAVSWIWAKSSSVVNEARVGYSYYFQQYLTNDSTQNPADYSFNGSTYNFNTGGTNPAFFGFPSITFQNLPSYALGAGSYQLVGPDGILDLVDNVSVLRGKHAFKFGGEVLNMENPVSIGSSKGSVRFANLPTFFNGVPNKASVLGGADLLRHFSTGGYAAFLQDDWHLKPRVQLRLGVRYEIDTVIKDSNGLLGNFNPNSATGLVQTGAGITSLYTGDHHNFSPRIGIAWDVRGDGRTVVRVGGNIIFEQLTNDVFGGAAGGAGLAAVPTGVPLYAGNPNTPVQSGGTINAVATTYNGTALTGSTANGGGPGDIAYNWQTNATNPLFSDVSPACGNNVLLNSGITATQCAITGVNPNLRSPYVTTWTLVLEHAITNNLGLEVAYVGNHGTKLISLTDVNEPPIGAGWTPGPSGTIAACLMSAPAYGNCSPDPVAEQATRPYNAKFPYLSYIDILGNGDTSNYNGLQTTLTERTSHGLSFVAAYTYSHALDDSSDNEGTLKVPIGAQKALYTNSDFDIRHRFTLTATYALPGRKGFAHMLEGWSVNSAVVLQSGLPWGAGDASNDFSGTGEISNRNSQLQGWDFIGNPSDFTMIHGFTNYNGGVLTGGTGGVPYYPGASNPACAAAAQKLDGGAAVGLAQAALANTGCFALGNSILIPPAYGTLGPVGRNIFRDSGFKNWDFSISKSFTFKERLRAQFRVEFFNILNHPDFANPYGGPSGGSGANDPSSGPGYGCGCVTMDEGGQNPVLGSGGPRNIQLGLKLLW